MTDTKGGFLAEEDDPHNSRAFRARQDPSVGPENKPAHMTLKEWERLQLLRQLRKRREGVFEPGISLDEKEAKKCRECGSREIDWQWEEVFGCCVCHRCKDKFPDKYSLLTKTEAREDYLLTTEELADEQLFRHLEKPNPHASHWSEMWLFLRYQIEEYAFSPKKWGSPEALDAEFSRREGAKKKRKEEKFQLKLKELKRKTRAEHYKRVNGEGGGEAKFGARIGGGKHEHEWGRTVEKADGSSVKTCLECGMEVEELEF
jgi:DNA-repair protein complementing XP-A cells